jgi:hypothetical protein
MFISHPLPSPVTRLTLRKQAIIEAPASIDQAKLKLRMSIGRSNWIVNGNPGERDLRS